MHRQSLELSAVEFFRAEEGDTLRGQVDLRNPLRFGAIHKHVEGHLLPQSRPVPNLSSPVLQNNQ